MTTAPILLAALVGAVAINRIAGRIAAAEAQRNMVDLLDLLGEQQDSDEIADNLDI